MASSAANVKAFIPSNCKLAIIHLAVKFIPADITYQRLAQWYANLFDLYSEGWTKITTLLKEIEDTAAKNKLIINNLEAIITLNLVTEPAIKDTFTISADNFHDLLDLLASGLKDTFRLPANFSVPLKAK